MLLKSETAVEAIKLLSDAIDSYPNAREALQFLEQTRFVFSDRRCSGLA